MGSEEFDNKMKQALSGKSTQDLVKRKKFIDLLKWTVFFLLLMTAGSVLYFMSTGVEAKRLLPFSFGAIILVILNFTLTKATRKIQMELMGRGYYDSTDGK